MPNNPLRYEPGLEHPEPAEGETTQALVETMRGIVETTFKDYGYPVRAVHAKSHGLLRGEMTVLGGFAPCFAQGLFAQPATYPVVLRFSTNPGDLLDDSISVPRGLLNIGHYSRRRCWYRGRLHVASVFLKVS